MGRKLDPRLADILARYDVDANAALWDCHGTWVILHKACEMIAAKAGVQFEPPMIIEANAEKRIVSVCVTARLGDHSEWSIGEAAPYNNKNGYPYAMAEKRAKDRCVLKLVGLHGEVYSEEEADKFKDGGTDKQPESERQSPAPEAGSDATAGTRAQLLEEIESRQTLDALMAWGAKNAAEISALPDAERTEIRKAFSARKATIKSALAA